MIIIKHWIYASMPEMKSASYCHVFTQAYQLIKYVNLRMTEDPSMFGMSDIQVKFP